MSQRAVTSSPAAAGWKPRNYYSKELTFQAHQSRLSRSPPAPIPASESHCSKQELGLAAAQLCSTQSSQGHVGVSDSVTQHATDSQHLQASPWAGTNYGSDTSHRAESFERQRNFPPLTHCPSLLTRSQCLEGSWEGAAADSSGQPHSSLAGVTAAVAWRARCSIRA